MLPSSDSANASLLGTSPTKGSGVSGVRRANSFLARYGGDLGPTGVAAGPKGDSDSPVSLANFMGGKAAGPRLGKLTGDGKSAPPEVESIYENRSVALPGLANPAAQYGGRSLASFLGDRADSLGHQRPVKTTSTSPVKASTGHTASTRRGTTDDESTRSARPAKYGFGQAELGRPVNASAEMQAPPSPKKAYLDLMEKQQASAPSLPVIHRASSPSKSHRLGGESISALPNFERSPSPTKRNRYVESGANVSRPLPVPADRADDLSSMNVNQKDAATSPINPKALADSMPEASTIAPLPQSISQRLQNSESLPSSRSSELSDSDRVPTSTLTRLNAQRMVGQRIKEAQLRDAAAQKELQPVQIGSGRSVPSSPVVRERCPPSSTSSQNVLSITKQTTEEGRTAPWSPNKFGNALPGLASPSPMKEAAASPWSASSLRKEPVLPDSKAEPVRLPGLGGSVSPFQRRETGVEQQAFDESVLTPLTKSRARGPNRRSGPVKTAAQATATLQQADKPSEQANQPVADVPALAAAVPTPESTNPLRRTLGPRIHVLISGSGSNLQSLIDATLANPPPGISTISDGQISFVLSNRKAAYGLTRAAKSNPPIPTKVLALKTWQNRNPGGTREEYDQVLARAVLDGPNEQDGSPLPDLIVLAGFMHIVSEPFLHALGHQTSLPSSTPTLGQRPAKPVPIINLHPALPHAFDGADAIPRALEAYKQGLVDKTGCMVHEVVADVDRGRPIIIREIPILPSYTLELLEEAIHKIEHVIIVQAADLVLKGYLQELDKQAGGQSESTQTRGLASRSTSPIKPTRHDQNKLIQIKGSRDAIAAARSLVSSNNLVWEKHALSSNVRRSSSIVDSTLVEAIVVGSDGTTDSVKLLGSTSEVRPEQVVYDDETLVIVSKSKHGVGSSSTQLWVRTGSKSALHPFELGPKSTSCPEGRKIAELAHSYCVQPRFVPAGCEEPDVIAALGGSWAVTRLGSRQSFDAAAPALYRVRQAISFDPTETEAFTISHVLPTVANVSSGDSFVSFGRSSAIVWHGKGSFSATRIAAVRFANAIARSDRAVETSEGADDDLFWRTLQETGRSASAWYHGAQAHLPRSTTSSLLDVELRQGQLTILPHSTKGYFGTDDLLLPTRNEKVSILNLEDRELFVIVGRDARSDKPRIAAALQIAQRFSALIQSHLRELVASDVSVVARPAVHVLVLPSKLPHEIRLAARIWSDEVVEYLQGPDPVQMNVLSGEQALTQLHQDTWALWQLQDADCLPVGIAPADVQHVL